MANRNLSALKIFQVRNYIMGDKLKVPTKESMQIVFYFRIPISLDSRPLKKFSNWLNKITRIIPYW